MILFASLRTAKTEDDEDTYDNKNETAQAY